MGTAEGRVLFKRLAFYLLLLMELGQGNGERGVLGSSP